MKPRWLLKMIKRTGASVRSHLLCTPSSSPTSHTLLPRPLAMSAYEANPQNYVVYGPDANCTLALCPAEASVYQYRPSLAVNTLFLVIFGLALIIHASLGLRYRTWAFATAMILGCVAEIIGYGGRIFLWQNPFSFDGFLMQISMSRAMPQAAAVSTC